MNRLRRTSVLFMVILLVSLPFYSALVLAELSVVRNTGRAGVNGFIDAQGDQWSLDVNALIPGQTVFSNQVNVNGFTFDSCTPGVGGTFLCRYTFNFQRSSILESRYPLDIHLFKSGESSALSQVESVIVADGSAPRVSGVQAQQTGLDITVSFTVKEEPDFCVGLHKIEFFDAVSGVRLRVLEGVLLAQKASSACGQNQLTEVMVLPQRAGPLAVRVIAHDLLNHSSVATSNNFRLETVGPNIIDNTLRLGSFAQFVPGGAVTVPLTVRVVEDHDDLAVFGTSSVLGMTNEAAQCTKTDIVAQIFTCTWRSRPVTLGQPFSVVVLASDGVFNQTKTMSVGISLDTTPPVVDFFGTSRVFQGVNYARPFNNTIVARFTESQSGMDASAVLADLSGLNPVLGIRRHADNCTQSSSTQWSCVWNSITVIQDGTIFLVQARDLVGNDAALLPQAPVILDVDAPTIDNISIVALAGQTGSARDYFQSRDVLRVTFTVVEPNGANARANVSDVVSGTSMVNARCTLNAGSTTTSTCTFTTSPIVSGFDPDGRITLIAEDTAGNIAEKTISFEILATDSDTQPDFWRRGEVACSPESLDINTVKLARQRVFCSIPLQTGADVVLASTQLVGCSGDTSKLSKAFLTNNFAGSKTPALILEFNPFTDKVDSLSYECSLRLFSRRSTVAIQQAEDEKFNVTVPFYVTQFDKELGAIEEEIDDAKEEAESGFYGVIGVLNDIVKWARIICSTVLLLADVVRRVMNAFNVGLEGLRGNPFTFPIAVAGCETAEAVGSKSEFFLFTIFKPICEFVTCKRSTLNVFSADAGAWWDKTVASSYYKYGTLNILKEQDLNAARTALVDPSSSLPSAIVNLCLPGIVYNLEKLRQIQCRYVSCLEEEVKSGVATVQSCRELRDFMECKYVWGNLFQAIPFVALVDALFEKVKRILSDPVGLLRLGATVLCTKGCAWSNSGTVACNVAAWVFGSLDLYNDIAGLATGYQTINEDYCSQVLD